MEEILIDKLKELPETIKIQQFDVKGMRIVAYEALHPEIGYYFGEGWKPQKPQSTCVYLVKERRLASADDIPQESRKAISEFLKKQGYRGRINFLRI